MSSQLSHRHLALIDRDTPPAVVLAHFRDVAGLRIGAATDVIDPTTAAATFPHGADRADGYLLPTLGVAVLNADEDQLAALRNQPSEQTGAAGGLLALEPERALWPAHATNPPEPSGTPHNSGSANSGPPGRPNGAFPPRWLHPRMTPGIELPHLTGVGVRVAILDTGINPDDPDFADYPVYGISMVPGTSPRDVHGHGTHMAAITRYLAPDVELYVAKVFPDQIEPVSPGPAALDGYVLSALEWCVQHAVDIAVLPAAAPANGGHSDVFEFAARRVLDHDVLLIAAAGNHSDRDAGVVEPVAHPANCPSVLAVAALASTQPPGWAVTTYSNAPYSNAGVGSGGQIDIAAPGGSTETWPAGAPHGLTGTSVAAAYTAGVAALISADTLARGRSLWAHLTSSARRLHQLSVDVGAGLAYTDVMNPALQPRP